MAPPNPDPGKVPPNRQGPPTSRGGGFTYTPPADNKDISKGAAFTAWMKKHPGMKKYSDQIWKWAREYGVDPTYLAALIFFESGGNPLAKSNKGAVGLAQIHMGTWRGAQTPWGATINEEWAQNPANAIRFAAWYFSQGVAQAGSYEDAYTRHYNPGYQGASPFASVPKGYVPKGAGLSPAESASVNVETQSEAAAITATWAVRTKNGVKFVQAPEPPKGTIKWLGEPVSQSSFLQAKQKIDDIYLGYVGRRSKPEEVSYILNQGLSEYALANSLAKSPRFKQGPIYQARGPGLILRARQLFGENWKPDGDLIRKAIVQNWDEATLVANLRKRPEYLRGPEFKKDEAGLLSVHQSIMGTPDEAARVGIREATLGGWSQDQYAAYLRGSDAYKHSPEYQTKALAFAEAMGLVSGRVPTLQPGVAEGEPQPAISPPPPDSRRIPGKPGLNPSNDLAVTGGY